MLTTAELERIAYINNDPSHKLLGKLLQLEEEVVSLENQVWSLQRDLNEYQDADR